MMPLIKNSPDTAKPGFLRRFLSVLGPGLITGAADDDPSGIATYSVAGAQFGTAFLWTALFTWPLMAAVQMMCARIGMVTGEGLASALQKKLPRKLLIAACLALFAANTINIGADLAGMADAAEMLTGISSHFFVVLFGILIAWATIRLSYYHIARTLKWLTLFLFAYVLTAIHVGPDWLAVIRTAIQPRFPSGREGWAMLVAILGTTISPYLFFWQASQEVEEDKRIGRRMLVQRYGATKKEIIDRKLDVGCGTLFSNLVMFFIILTTALTLHTHGITKIETSRQAAEALRPLAGGYAAALFTIGIIGVGFLAIPTLSGSAAYALAETFGWHHGLDERLSGAKAFYGVIILSTLTGIVMDFANLNPVKALYWTAVINGLLAPFFLLGILICARNGGLMQNQPSSKLGWYAVALATTVMFGAAIGMFVF
jgi:Mn2+/Fe2+ NRAMP family transporter